MDRFDRIYALHKELTATRHGRSVAQLSAALECDASTTKRIIRMMRDYLEAPIVYDRALRAYRYDTSGSERRYELPGLWFTADELLALATIQHLLSGLQPGLLDTELAPLRQRVDRLLDHQHLGRGDLAPRLRVLSSATRGVAPATFRVVAGALAARHQLQFSYHARATDERTSRQVAPQRLVHYRDNWYLDAWDPMRGALRTFALDRITAPSAVPTIARDLPADELDAHLATSYGIFAGPPTSDAVLRFTAQRARWVADETWHPAQRGRWLEDGRYELTLPCRESPELVMDILKHGPEVEVLAPESLRSAIAAALRTALARYT